MVLWAQSVVRQARENKDKPFETTAYRIKALQECYPNIIINGVVPFVDPGTGSNKYKFTIANAAEIPEGTPPGRPKNPKPEKRLPLLPLPQMIAAARENPSKVFLGTPPEALKIAYPSIKIIEHSTGGFSIANAHDFTDETPKSGAKESADPLRKIPTVATRPAGLRLPPPLPLSNENNEIQKILESAKSRPDETISVSWQVLNALQSQRAQTKGFEVSIVTAPMGVEDYHIKIAFSEGAKPTTPLTSGAAPELTESGVEPTGATGDRGSIESHYLPRLNVPRLTRSGSEAMGSEPPGGLPSLASSPARTKPLPTPPTSRVPAIAARFTPSGSTGTTESPSTTPVTPRGVGTASATAGGSSGTTPAFGEPPSEADILLESARLNPEATIHVSWRVLNQLQSRRSEFTVVIVKRPTGVGLYEIKIDFLGVGSNPSGTAPPVPPAPQTPSTRRKPASGAGAGASSTGSEKELLLTPQAPRPTRPVPSPSGSTPRPPRGDSGEKRGTGEPKNERGGPGQTRPTTVTALAKFWNDQTKGSDQA